VHAWTDGTSWVVADREFARAPLFSYRADHRRVTMFLPLPPTRARGIRIEVPPLVAPGRKPPFDLPMDYWHWRRWGVHEIGAFAPSLRADAPAG
jgi:hypothetical protein